MSQGPGRSHWQGENSKKQFQGHLSWTRWGYYDRFIYTLLCGFPLEKAMAPHSSTLAWKIPWTEETGGLQSMGSRLSNFTFTFHFHALVKEMATYSSVLAWGIPGMAEPGGLLSTGSHRVRHNWSYLAAAAAVWLPWWLSGEESTCDARDMSLIPGLERSPGERNGDPLQFSCLGNPMDRGA